MHRRVAAVDVVREILKNRAVIVPASAWLLAQLIKVITVVIKDKKLDFSRFVGSGGMPSSHSAYIVSMSTVVGKNMGWGSVPFGISLAVALIVMYDAAGVRRAAGKQAEVLNKIIFNYGYKEDFDQKLKELIGHTPFEVLVGALLGILIGYLFG